MEKKMKKIRLLPLSLAILTACCHNNVYSESFTAKSAGQGFTRITQDFTSALSNPALLSKYDDDDDVYFSLNLGLMVSDNDDVIDKGEGVADDIDFFSDSIDNLINIPPQDLPAYTVNLHQQVENITNTLAEIDKKPAVLREGLSALIIVPNQYLDFGVFINQYGRLGLAVDYSETDEDILTNAITTGEFDSDDLESSAIGVGYAILEAGIMLGYPVVKNEDYDINIGTKIKYQRLDLFYNKVNIAEFDEDEFDLTDDEFLTDSDGVNFDLGLYAAFGSERQWGFALVVNDLAEQDITLDAQNLTFTLETSAKVGVSYQIDWVTLAAEIDLIERSSFEQLKPVKYASVGAEFRWSEHVQFRLGARTDVNDNEVDVYTLGLGLSPWDVISLDIAAFKGDNDNGGLALQLGLKI